MALSGTGTEGRVTLVEPVGEEALVHIRVGDGDVVARVRGEPRPAVGEAVRVSAPRERVCVFDASTGERVPWS